MIGYPEPINRVTNRDITVAGWFLAAALLAVGVIIGATSIMLIVPDR